MLKYIIPIVLFFSLTSYAQTSFFTKNTAITIEINNDKRLDSPLKETFLNLDISALKLYLVDSGDRLNSTYKILSLPDENGNFKKYKIFEAPVLEPKFQENYPTIKSYAGQGVTNPQETLRFTITPKGFQAIILGTPNGTQHIKPYDLSRNLYTSFLNKDVSLDEDTFGCELIEVGTSSMDNLGNSSLNANDGILRNYRLALSSTGEFSAFYNSNLEDVIVAMSIAVSNANAVLERDLSVTLTLVDNTSLIFFDPDTDPFDNFDNIALLDQNQVLIDATVGDDNYDIGHVFNTAGGGVAGLLTSCLSGFKAWGVTGSSNPDGQRFIFVFLHELGHQFGSPHTFNGDEGSCAPNISEVTAVEPGSGSTLMSYPGLCNSQNVQIQGDLYYNQISLFTMWNHITNSGECPILQTTTGNNAPVADAGNDYLIPQGTPYKLNGNSTDTDGVETHTFTWEQNDLGPAGAPTETTLAGPLVRSFQGTNNPTRYLPNLLDLLYVQGSSDWEKLVNVDRDINFRLTVRDNDLRGGQTDSDDMLATVTTAAGPFVVTSQNTPNQIIWTPGTTETITWDVAGTTANGINEANVTILLSTDEGLTYETVLAANVPNDGSYDLVVPDIDEPKCRLMVESTNNIFFNINAAFFAIGDYSYQEDCQDIAVNFNFQIPENPNDAVNFPFQIDENLEISDLNVSIDVSGNADNSSLFFFLSPPFDTQNVYSLVTYPCPGTTGMKLTFDDEGSALNCNTINNGDRVLPLEPLSQADGRNPNGNWILFGGDIIVDGNVSTLNSITLSICSIQAIPNTMSTEGFVAFDNFSIYPNPSSGEFTLKFNTTTTEKVQVEVFDITGRLVYQETQNNSQTNFEKAIDLSHTQSGVYIVKVKQGNTSISKKLILK